MAENVDIMLVEDDEVLTGEIVSFLSKWGYMASVVRKFDDVISIFKQKRPSLVLLDVNLPCFDGFYWCRRIREISDVPIIYISSRGDDRDKIMAIAQGGDDYVEKPFRLEILKAKIEAILRRTYQYKVKERLYLPNDIWFDRNTASLGKEGKTVELTRSEKKIMEKLLECRPDIVAREELMMELWSTDEFVSDGTLTTLVSRLRDKLSVFCGDELIKTKKGQGYYIE